MDISATLVTNASVLVASRRGHSVDSPHNSFIKVLPEFAFQPAKLDGAGFRDLRMRSNEVVRLQPSRGGIRTRLIASLIGVPALVFASTLSASASDVKAPVIAPATSVSSASAYLASQLSSRLQMLTKLGSRISASKSLLPADRAALGALVTGEIAGLTSLRAASKSDSSIAQIRTDASTMVLSYHVFSFVSPLVQTVLRVDAARAAAGRISALIPSIKTAIVASAASNQRVAKANGLIGSVATLVSNITTSTAGLRSALVALSPSSIPGSLSTLASAGVTASAAESEVHVAYATIGRIVSLVTGSATRKAP